MKSFQLTAFGDPLEEADLPDPKPTGHEVVVAVKAAGVCHSDLHIWEGGYDLGRGKRLRLADRGIALPLTLGHETAGEIVSVGPEVKDRKVGEMVLVYPWIGCGVCRVCRAGSENLCMKPRCLGVHCDGGYSDQIVVPNSKYLLPLDGLDPVSGRAIRLLGRDNLFGAEEARSGDQGRAGADRRRRRARADGRQHPQGDGGQGRRRGGYRRQAPRGGARRRRPRRDRRLGARTRWRRSSRRSAALAGRRSTLSAALQTAALAFDSLAKGGKMIMVGLFGGAAPWSLPLIPMKATTIEGSYTGNLAETRELLDLVRSGGAPRSRSGRARSATRPHALEDLKAGRVVGRVVLTP